MKWWSGCAHCPNETNTAVNGHVTMLLLEKCLGKRILLSIRKQSSPENMLSLIFFQFSATSMYFRQLFLLLTCLCQHLTFQISIQTQKSFVTNFWDWKYSNEKSFVKNFWDWKYSNEKSFVKNFWDWKNLKYHEPVTLGSATHSTGQTIDGKLHACKTVSGRGNTTRKNASKIDDGCL